MSTTSTKTGLPDGASSRSPWVTVLEGTTGRIAAVTALIGAIIALLEKFTGLLKYASPWGVIISVVVTLLASIFFIREVQRIKSRNIRRPATVFIGADSFNETDRSRFFGREDEIERVTRKLIQPLLRFFILSGKSGCGKTSLIRAGLIPELKEKYGYHPIYVRLYNKPEKYLRDALQGGRASHSAEAQTIEIGTVAKSEARTSTDTLFDRLHAIRKFINKPILIFIDQFEEFFTNRITEDERVRFLNFVHSCVVDESNQHVKMIFSVRSDFLDDMSLFDDYVDEPFKKENRARIEMFDLKRARDVIKLSLEYAKGQGGDLLWSDALINRILNDLEIKQRDGISENARSIVLPAELQIVCQMVQAQRVSEAKEYLGKERLLRKYIEDAIETSPRPRLAKRVLLELINENGITRAKPQNPADIAKRLTDIDKDLVRSILEHLASPCRLVNPLKREGAEGTGDKLVYELSHEYLVSIINKLSGKVIDVARRANTLLEEYRRRLAFNPSFRISITDCWRIHRHATETIEPEIRQALHRSERAFILWLTAVILTPTLAILAVRYSTVHFSLRPRSSVVVIQRGLPFFQPLLGSNKMLVDTGLHADGLSEEGLKGCEGKLWTLNLWPATDKHWKILTQWRVDALLNQLRAEETHEKVEAAEELIRLNIIEPRVIDALLATLARGSGDQIDRAANLLLLINVRDDRVSNILNNRLDSLDVKKDGSLIGPLVKSKWKLNPNDEAFLNKLIDKYEEAVTLYSDPQNQDFGQEISLKYYIEGVVAALGDLRVANQRVIEILLRALSERERPLDRFASSAANSLGKLNVKDPRVIEVLLARINNAQGDFTPDMLRPLIKLGILNGDIREKLVDKCHTEVERKVFCSFNIIHYLLLLNPKDELAINSLLGHLQQPPVDELNILNSEFQRAACTLISKFKVKDERLINSILGILRTSNDPFFNVEAVNTLQALGIDDERIAEALRPRVSDDKGSPLIIGPALSRLHIKDNPALESLPIFVEVAGVKNDQSFGTLLMLPAADTYARLALFNPSEKFETQLERLWKQMSSDEAEKSRGYRRCVQYALVLLAEQQLKDGAQNYNKVEAIRSKVQQWREAAEPHHRIAAYETLEFIDGMIRQINNPAEEWTF